jgi:hypothetical protein
VKIGEPIAKWIVERIGRWTGAKIVERTTDQTQVVNCVALIGRIMLPANVAVTEGTTLVRCR